MDSRQPPDPVSFAALREYLLQRSRELEAVCQELTDQGFEARITTTAVPIQIVGKLPDGDFFYFRARGSSARLAAWPNIESFDDLSPDLFFSPPREAKVERWEWPDAGWLEASEVREAFHELYRTISSPSCT
jgi:hypothetical protein